MRAAFKIRDPVTLKRLKRFRRKKRSYWSLIALTLLFLVSLASEFLCNDRPLYLRFRGKSYFPALRFYPEDEFLGNSKLTRPNYRALAQRPPFVGDPGSFMLFAPVPYGPFESIDPSSLRSEETVSLRFSPVPRVGHVNIKSDLIVAGSRSCGFFFACDDAAVIGLSLSDHWALGPDLRDAVNRRFQNMESPRISVSLRGAKGPEAMARVSLASFVPRQVTPSTVRITFREPMAGTAGDTEVVFRRDIRLRGRPPSVWTALANEQRAELTRNVESAFNEHVEEQRIEIAGVSYRVAVSRNDITWPHRPVPGHWFGIDSAGRDVFARILYGLRTALLFGLVLVFGAMLVGSVVGATQGYHGGLVDITGQRLIEVWSALPFLYIVILMGSVFGSSFILLLVCYGLFNWIRISYYMRAEFLRLRRRPFVDAARCIGIPARKVMFRHVMPNAITPLITLFPFSLVTAIVSLAALDYLGFGLPPPTPSWGELLQQAQRFRWAWWLILYPFVALVTVGMLGVFIGEGVRDAFDPRPYSRME